MRELKFRAWDIDSKIMTPAKHVGELTFIADEKTVIVNEQFETSHELMQYTGLKDQNGKEIYDGDILEFPYRQNNGTFDDEVAEIKFIDGQFVLRDVGPLASWNLKSEVIGNIYENKELLK